LISIFLGEIFKDFIFVVNGHPGVGLSINLAFVIRRIKSIGISRGPNFRCSNAGWIFSPDENNMFIFVSPSTTWPCGKEYLA